MSVLPPSPMTPTTVSRRNFLRGAGALAVGLPLLTESQLAYAAQSHKDDLYNSGAVLLNANENPLGPCKAACEVISSLGCRAGRYDFSSTIKLADMLQQQEGLKPGYLALYAGSSEPLQYAVLAFTGPGKSFVCADPAYEAGAMAAASNHAPVHQLALRTDYSHDVKGMVAADPNAGCYYICNPNNPSGSITTRDDIIWLLDHKPKNAVVIVDEAYIHYSNAHTVLDLATADRDLIVLRSFSKIYGLAGLRAGYAVARPDLLARLALYGMNPLSLPGIVAASASLQEKALVTERRVLNEDVRDQTVAWLAEQKYSVIPSDASFFMVDVKRPGADFTAEMEKHNIYLGRTWAIWPNHVRVSVGTADEMARFRAAFAAVAARPWKPAKA